MHLLLLFAGLLLAPLPADAVAPEELYDRVKATVEREAAIDAFEPEVTAYIRALLRKQLLARGVAPAALDDRIPTEEDILAILRDRWTDVCGRLEGHSGPSSRPECLEMVSDVRRIAADEMRVRRLGRELQAEATGYELPLSDLPGRSAQVAADLRGILSIWGAGGGAAATTVSGSLLRTVSFAERVGSNPGLYQQLFNDVAFALSSLDAEERIAAVWRYQYGVRLVRDERAPGFPAPHPYTPLDSGPGTERQFLFKRWEQDPDLEGKLLAIWQEVRGALQDPQVFAPPLQPEETALITFPQELLDLLPDNVLLWVRLDGNYEAMHPMGDIGLQWVVPLEPVLPSLTWEEDPILGGAYPPEPVRRELSGSTLVSLPVDGAGLCSTPAGGRGYLCRPVEALAEGGGCPLPPNAPADAIRLTWCAAEEDARRFTAAGADVCREIPYRSTPFDAQRSCRLQLQCAPACTPPAGSIAGVAAKTAAGDVSVCQTDDPNRVPPRYAFEHTLVIAQYRCGLPPGASVYRDVPGGPPEEAARIREANAVLCCELEGAAQRAMCDLLERDGAFLREPMQVDGVVLTAEVCAEIRTDRACRARPDGRGCYLSRAYPPAVLQAMDDRIRSNPAGSTLACADMMDDPRVSGIVTAIEGSTGVCTPGALSEYPNRIGNNLCFIGQCVEQSLEHARLTPSRTPSTAGGALGAWDDPRTGTPLAPLLTQAPPAQVRFDDYRPQLLLRAMETALCQAQGMPPRTPPIRCALSAQRQLGLERPSNLLTILGIVQQQSEQTEAFTDLLQLAPALGARAGSALYARYLEEASRSFAQILSTAADLLTEMTAVRFPAQMCPIGPGLPAPLP